MHAGGPSCRNGGLKEDHMEVFGSNNDIADNADNTRTATSPGAAAFLFPLVVSYLILLPFCHVSGPHKCSIRAHRDEVS